MEKNRHEALFWHLFSGTRGGLNRVRMLQLLFARPYNLNQIATKLGMDYKTAAHHLEVLAESGLVQPGEKKYGGLYFPSEFAKGNIGLLREIWKRLGKS
ncbi:MAG: winged helix-turn-helix domain-containing protein [Candidatus Anstonellaceae archaeon]